MLYDQYFIDDLKDRADLVRRSLVIWIFLLAFAISGSAQEPPRAVLADDDVFRIGCEDVHGRIDNFFSEIINEKESTGLVIIRVPPAKKHLALFAQQEVEYYMDWHRFPKNRIEFARVTEGERLNVQFWRVPPGPAKPQINDVDMTLAFPAETKPFVFGSEFEFRGEVCPDPNIPAAFADFLKANPTARGNIVVREVTIRKAQLKGSRILRTFQKKYAVNRSRFRIFPTIRTKGLAETEPIVEYWYLP